MKNTKSLVLAGATLALAGCASMMYTPPTEQESIAAIKDSFRDRSVAKVDRLNQNEVQKECSKVALQRTELAPATRTRLEQSALGQVRYPADGKMLGDWKEGEKVAQSGVGMQFSDTDKTINGGNCYACHELTKQEISFGNIGPSLRQYGKLRNYDAATVKYTWGKIWNSHAFNACSSMPPYGASGILTETQIKNVMALLLDPASPVNQ